MEFHSFNRRHREDLREREGGGESVSDFPIVDTPFIIGSIRLGVVAPRSVAPRPIQEEEEEAGRNHQGVTSRRSSRPKEGTHES